MKIIYVASSFGISPVWNFFEAKLLIICFVAPTNYIVVFKKIFKLLEWIPGALLWAAKYWLETFPQANKQNRMVKDNNIVWIITKVKHILYTRESIYYQNSWEKKI